ncbi:hypothetical protein CYMTET_52590 [Cymbomonas tetramitiformis]|uniref:Uncharacterized protein n=1 Tax=Cymbomonas tetramitiformis TaxID=36881 RepID=A0AAE0BIQ8_9CHLO|nr:hypothetical protein CYMTET_52590 [Cymbomonas tetramitiformis]
MRSVTDFREGIKGNGEVKVRHPGGGPKSQWGEHTVDRYNSDISTQLPRTGVPSVARRQVGMQLEVHGEDGDAWYPGSIMRASGDPCRRVRCDDGKDEGINLWSETSRTLLPRGSEGAPEERDSALGAWRRAQLGEHPDTELSSPWLPAAEDAVLLHMGALLRRGTVAAGSMQRISTPSKTTKKTLGSKGQQGAVWWVWWLGALEQQDVAVVQAHITFVLRQEKAGQQVQTKRQLVIPPQAVSGLPEPLEVWAQHRGRGSPRAASGESLGDSSTHWLGSLGDTWPKQALGALCRTPPAGATPQGTALGRVQRRVHGQSERPLKGGASLSSGTMRVDQGSIAGSALANAIVLGKETYSDSAMLEMQEACSSASPGLIWTLHFDCKKTAKEEPAEAAVSPFIASAE